MAENESLSLWPEPEPAPAEVAEDAVEISGSAEVVLRIGDARELIKDVPDGSVDLIATSPPYLALRSYLPADHPDKAREMGSERSPAEFLDNLLGLTAEFRRVLAPYGSIAIELGDTMSSSGGGGGDYLPGGLREGQPGFTGSAHASAEAQRAANAAHWRAKNRERPRDTRPDHANGLAAQPDRPEGGGGPGWPLSRSLCAIPALYQVALAYGINPLTGEESPAGRWRVRNLVIHGRPNPPVGALGDKWRPACSYWTVACVDRRWFDLDGVRKAPLDNGVRSSNGPKYVDVAEQLPGRRDRLKGYPTRYTNAAGAPPLDWIDDQYDEDLWPIPTTPYKGSHYAVFSPELIRRFIVSMCPQRVCTVCGKPSVRLTDVSYESVSSKVLEPKGVRGGAGAKGQHAQHMEFGRAVRQAHTIGWSDCGHTVQVLGVDVPAWRRGLVLDPFGGSGTTGMVAAGNGRDALLFDLNAANVDLVRQRCGFFLREERDADE